jgi:hypothetical protein
MLPASISVMPTQNAASAPEAIDRKATHCPGKGQGREARVLARAVGEAALEVAALLEQRSHVDEVA